MYLTLVNVGKVGERTPESPGRSRAASHHWFLRINWQMSPFMDKINLFRKLDEKSRDHEVIIGESDNSLAGEIKRIIKEKPWYKRLLVVLLTMERYEVTLCSP